HLRGIVQLAGYQRIREFRGNLFWRTSIFEAEAFDVYRRTGVSMVRARYLVMADPTSTNQLLSGLYPIENNAWRWSARTFTVVLKTPESASLSGARLEAVLYVPAVQIQRLGALTLNGTVN